jgi:hypothetical protein
MPDSKEKALNDAIIETYRQLIASRYEFEKLSTQHVLPKQIDEEMIKNIRNFFLMDVYPDAVKRQQVEAAFETLGSYVNQPKKAMVLFGSVASALFIFGRHLPLAINAGVVTLQSFLDARKMETNILKAAKENFLEENLTVEGLKHCIANIPEKDLKDFIKQVKEMFYLMSNTELLDKTIKIIDMVIDKMKSKPELYPSNDVNGILLGRNILQNGLNLFKGLNTEKRKEIADAVYQIEIAFIDSLHKK